jgi:hypothetical protein
MDTVTSNLPMAMGPGEQRAIHPFFQKGDDNSMQISQSEADCF